MKAVVFVVFIVILVLVGATGINFILEPVVGRSVGAEILMIALVLNLIFSRIRMRRNLSPAIVDTLKFFPPTTPIPQKLIKYHNEIVALGFELAGECTIQNALTFWSPSRMMWIYFDPSRTITAWLHAKPRIDFNTIYTDGFLLATNYPSGLKFEKDEFIFRTISKSLEAAWQHHQEECLALREQHGALTVIYNWQQIKDTENRYVSIVRDDLTKYTDKALYRFGMFFFLLGLSFAYIRFALEPTLDDDDRNPFLSLCFMLFGLFILISPYLWAARGIWIIIRDKHRQNTGKPLKI